MVIKSDMYPVILNSLDSILKLPHDLDTVVKSFIHQFKLQEVVIAAIIKVEQQTIAIKTTMFMPEP